MDKLWPGLLLLNGERCHTRDRALPLGTAALGEHLTIRSEDSNTGNSICSGDRKRSPCSHNGEIETLSTNDLRSDIRGTISCG